MVLERHFKNFCQRHTVTCWYKEECFSFETAEPWLKNERHYSLYPSVLHYILGKTTSVETTVYDHRCKEQRPPEIAAPRAANLELRVCSLFCKILLAFLPCSCSSVSPSHCSVPSDSQTSLLPSPIRKNDLLSSLDLLYSHKVASDLFCFQSTFIYKRLSRQLLLYSLKNMAPGITKLFPEDSRAVTRQSHGSMLLLPARLPPGEGNLLQHLLNRWLFLLIAQEVNRSKKATKLTLLL